MDKKEIQKKVLDLIKNYKTRDPYLLVNKLGYFIQIGDLGMLPGCCIKLEGQMIIFINNDMNASMKKVVVAHELGHVILHSDNYPFNSHTKYDRDLIEAEAHIFAAELLISDELIKDHSDYTIKQLSKLTGYAEWLIEFKKYGYTFPTKDKSVL